MSKSNSPTNNSNHRRSQTISTVAPPQYNRSPRNERSIQHVVEESHDLQGITYDSPDNIGIRFVQGQKNNRNRNRKRFVDSDSQQNSSSDEKGYHKTKRFKKGTSYSVFERLKKENEQTEDNQFSAIDITPEGKTYQYPSCLPSLVSYVDESSDESSSEDNDDSHNPRKSSSNKEEEEKKQPKDQENSIYYGTFTRKMFKRVYSSHLQIIIKDNMSSPGSKEKHAIFFSVTTPKISIYGYIDRLVTYTHCSPTVFIVALIYLERIGDYHHQLRPSFINIHRLLITSITVAVKLLDDRTFSIAHYAKVGGVPSVKEMIRLELAFLECIKYNTYVKFNTYGRMHEKLEKLHQQLKLSENDEDNTCNVQTEESRSDGLTCPAAYVAEAVDSSSNSKSVLVSHNASSTVDGIQPGLDPNSGQLGENKDVTAESADMSTHFSRQWNEPEGQISDMEG